MHEFAPFFIFVGTLRSTAWANLACHLGSSSSPSLPPQVTRQKEASTRVPSLARWDGRSQRLVELRQRFFELCLHHNRHIARSLARSLLRPFVVRPSPRGWMLLLPRFVLFARVASLSSTYTSLLRRMRMICNRASFVFVKHVAW